MKSFFSNANMQRNFIILSNFSTKNKVYFKTIRQIINLLFPLCILCIVMFDVARISRLILVKEFLFFALFPTRRDVFVYTNFFVRAFVPASRSGAHNIDLEIMRRRVMYELRQTRHRYRIRTRFIICLDRDRADVLSITFCTST